MNAIGGEGKIRAAKPLAIPGSIQPLLRPSAESVVRAILNDPIVRAAMELPPMSTSENLKIEVPLRLPPKIRDYLFGLVRRSNYKVTVKIGEGNELLLVITRQAKKGKEASGSNM